MEIHYYAVIPSTSAGIGQAVLDDIVLGKLKDAPFTESFADGYVWSTGWVADADVANYGTVWYILADGDEMTSQDDDNGFALCYNGNYYNSYHWSDLITPKVKVDPTQQYTLSFYVYMGAASSATVMPTLVVSQSIDDAPYEELTTIDVTEGDGEWVLVELPLTGAELGHFVKVCFRGNMSVSSERIWLDNIRISSVDKPSSGVNELAVPQQVTAIKGGISVEGFEGQQVRVYTIDGRQAGAFIANGNGTLSVAPGIYIVTVGKQSFKVSVR